MGTEPLVCGWRERVDLPDWGVRRLLAKADTGARSSAVHAENIEELPGDRVAFDVVYSRAHPDHRTRVECDIARRAHIRSSTGESADRLIVRTTLRMGKVRRDIELSLVSRELMSCRMLIGRTALEGLLVDPATAYRLTTKPRAQRGTTRGTAPRGTIQGDPA